MNFGKRSNPPCTDCDEGGHCTMNCGPASVIPRATIKILMPKGVTPPRGVESAAKPLVCDVEFGPDSNRQRCSLEPGHSPNRNGYGHHCDKPVHPVYLNDMSDYSATVDEWLRTLAALKGVYGGQAILSTDAGPNNVDFTILRRP